MFAKCVSTKPQINSNLMFLYVGTLYMFKFNLLLLSSSQCAHALLCLGTWTTWLLRKTSWYSLKKKQKKQPVLGCHEHGGRWSCFLWKTASFGCYKRDYPLSWEKWLFFAITWLKMVCLPVKNTWFCCYKHTSGDSPKCPSRLKLWSSVWQPHSMPFSSWCESADKHLMWKCTLCTNVNLGHKYGWCKCIWIWLK